MSDLDNPEVQIPDWDCGDKRIHPWASRLVLRLRQAGIRTSDIVRTRTKYGYCSAYFGVFGIGEVRVSDHPMSGKQASDVSISNPVSYLDLLKAYAFYHNRHHSVQLAVLEDPPTLMEVSAAERHLAALEEDAKAKAATQGAYNRLEAERRAFWQVKVAESGLEGTYQEVKFQLKMMGVRHTSVAQKTEDAAA
jgi:hypothetical protein|nr:hypothetical protein [Neorhizobium tomejilense]